MNLIQRFGYYLGGFSLGLIILAFFLNGKKVSCSYGPDARVLKNINSKLLKYSDAVLITMNQKEVDSATIKHILLKGDINFGKDATNPRKEPCGIYYVEDDFNDNEIGLVIENCDSIATLLSLYIK